MVLIPLAEWSKVNVMDPREAGRLREAKIKHTQMKGAMKTVF